MPGNPAVPCTTPESLAEQENRVADVRVSSKTLKEAMTEPRRRNPLQSIDLNRPTPTNQVIKAAADRRSASAPLLTKKVSASKLVDGSSKPAKDSSSNPLDRGKRLVEDAAPDNPASKRSKSTRTPNQDQDQAPTQARAIWKYSSDKRGVVEITAKLELEDVPSECSTPLELLRFLESRGRLSPRVLGLFSRCPGVQVLSLALSYGCEVNDLGLREAGTFPFYRCTLPFFHGYKDLQVLDLTCVPVGDEQLRYIIRLAKLQALGLSRTEVTGRGLRYLGKHADFAPSLQCLKLCHVDKLRDEELDGLKAFKCLRELDLFGCNKISLKGLIDLLPDNLHELTLATLRPPSKICSLLGARHSEYARIRQQSVVYVDDPEEVAGLSLDEVQVQLRIHQKQYPHIFLNLDCDCLRRKLTKVLRERSKEEYLWRISQ